MVLFDHKSVTVLSLHLQHILELIIIPDFFMTYIIVSEKSDEVVVCLMPAFLFCLCAARGREGLVQPDRPGDPAFILPHGAGGPGLAEEPGLPRGRLERRLLTAAGRTHPCHTHSSSLCQVCVFSVHPCFIFKSEGSLYLRLEGLLWALLGPPHDPGP